MDNNNETRPVGRPSTYNENYCEMVIKHMEQGYSIESFAGVIDVHKDTIYEWKKHHEEFSDAVKKGVAKSQLFWEQLGIKGTMGLPVKYKEKVRDADGNVIEVEKTSANFNPTCWIFNMKNRFNWTDRQDLTSGDEKFEPVQIYKPEKKPEGAAWE